MLAELEQKLGLPSDHQEVSFSEDFGYASTLRGSLLKNSSDDDDGNDDPGRPRRAAFRRGSAAFNQDMTGSAEASRPPRPRQPAPSRGRPDSVDTGWDETNYVAVPVQEQSGSPTPSASRKIPSPEVHRVEQKSTPPAAPALLDVTNDDDDSYGFDEVDANATPRQPDRRQSNPNSTFDLKNKSRSKPAPPRSGATIKPASGARVSATPSRSNPPRSAISRNKPSSVQRKNKSRSELSIDDDDIAKVDRVKWLADTSELEQTTATDVTYEAGRRGVDDEADLEVEQTTSRLEDTSIYDDDDNRGIGAAAAAGRTGSGRHNGGVNNGTANGRRDDSDDNDEDGYETNDELMDTVTIYQKHLESTNYHDERGRDTDDDDANSEFGRTMTGTGNEAAAQSPSRNRSPPVPSPRKR